MVLGTRGELWQFLTWRLEVVVSSTVAHSRRSRNLARLYYLSLTHARVVEGPKLVLASLPPRSRLRWFSVIDMSVVAIADPSSCRAKQLSDVLGDDYGIRDRSGIRGMR